MDQVTVSLDALNHLIAENETTVCGLPVPMGTVEIPGTNPCPVCFPDTVKAEKPKAKAKTTKGKVI